MVFQARWETRPNGLGISDQVVLLEDGRGNLM